MTEWFSYTVGGGFALHETKEAARAAALADLDICRDESVDGWREDVTGICWGRLSEAVVCTSSKPDPSGWFDTLDEYSLVKP